MAAQIDGFTVHHWAGITVAEDESAAGTKDTSKMSTKCKCLRFVIIDEISMVSAEMLGAVESILKKVMRVRSGYKRRSDGSTRAFGGLNVLFFGDWWQLPPVGGTALFSNPLDARGTAAEGMDIFWASGRDSIRQLWELTQPMRCPDEWYNAILNMFRQGELTTDAYSMLHGFPTATPGQWDLNSKTTTRSCGEDVQVLP